MHSTEETFDDSEGDETTNVDSEGDDVVAEHPFGDGEAWTEVGIEAEEGWPGGVGESSCEGRKRRRRESV